MTEDYNYATFDLPREEPVFAAFRGIFGVGQQAPDATLEDLSSGETLTLRSLWSTGLVVMEFGSFT